MDRRLRLTQRFRPFTWQGARYAHTSAVPLAYLSGSAPMWTVLEAFTDPLTIAQALPPRATEADLTFFDELTAAGILVDADEPDPVHAFTGRAGHMASLTLFATNSCNLRCVYCYASSGPGSGPRLSVEHSLFAVDAFFTRLEPTVETVELDFRGGGEPTTNFPVVISAWQHFTALAKERGVKATASIVTNGTFGPAVLKELTSPEWKIVVSYDGPRQAAQRPTAADKDSRDRVVANLHALKAAGKTLTTRATLTRDGLPYLKALVDDAAELGIGRVQVEPASMVGRGANLLDGPPDPREFAEAFLEAFRYALERGVQLSTASWSHTRVGDGRNCGAISGLMAITPDGFISACTEVCDGSDPTDPFIVGRLDTVGPRLEIWPVREGRLQERTGYALEHCRSCFMVDTCAGGCASRARAHSGSAFVKDDIHCVISQRVNTEIIADLADGRLMPDAGWQPRIAVLPSGASSVDGMQGRVVSLVPAFARRRWNLSPSRRPIFPASRADSMFFHTSA